MAQKKPTAQEQFSQHYEEYADAIYRHCYFRIGNQERAKELMQDAFIKTWQYLEKGKEIEYMQAFLYQTANRLIIDDVRRNKLRTVHSLETMQEDGFDIGTDIDEKEMKLKIDAQNVLKTLEQVKQPYRDAVIMRHIDCLSPAEIAEITGESENVISVRIHRGVKMLRSLVKTE